MAYRFRRRTRRTTLRRRRPMRRRPMMRRRPRLASLKVHHFKRTDTASTLTGSITDAFGGMAFTFNDIPNNTEFTNLFDQYRINKVVLKWVPLANSANAGTQSTTLFYSVLDYTDDTVPTTEQQLVEYASLKITQGLRQHTRIFTPTTLDSLTDDTGAATYSGNPKIKQWISTSSPNVPHYGVKYLRPAQPTGQLVNYKLIKTFYFSCRSVK